MQLKELLEPIRGKIGLRDEWWDAVENICEELIKAFNGEPNVRWWGHIFDKYVTHGSGRRSSFYGWFICDLLGFGSAIQSFSSLNDGVVTVPMKITDMATGISEDSTFAAGIAGSEMFKEEDSRYASIKAVHGWTLMLEPDSVYREDLINWESQYVQGA